MRRCGERLREYRRFRARRHRWPVSMTLGSNDAEVALRCRWLSEEFCPVLAENNALPVVPIREIGTGLHLNRAASCTTDAQSDLPVRARSRRAHPEPDDRDPI